MTVHRPYSSPPVGSWRLAWLHDSLCNRFTNNMKIDGLCFLFRVDLGMIVFLTTPSLSRSQKKLVIGIPNMHSLSRRAIQRPMKSLASLVETSSDLNVAGSTVFCTLQCDRISAFWTNLSTLVCDRRVTTLFAWSESTKTVILIRTPSGLGASGGSTWHSPRKFSHNLHRSWSVLSRRS